MPVGDADPGSPGKDAEGVELIPARAANVVLSEDPFVRLDHLSAADRIHGGRYDAATQREIDTEEAA